MKNDEIISAVQENSIEKKKLELKMRILMAIQKTADLLMEKPKLPALVTAFLWFENQNESCATQLLFLKRMRDVAAKKDESMDVKKQFLITCIT